MRVEVHPRRDGGWATAPGDAAGEDLQLLSAERGHAVRVDWGSAVDDWFSSPPHSRIAITQAIR